MSGLELDGAAIVRSASRGFTVLLLGGVVQPWVIRLAPAVGYAWLAIVAVAAFVVAARMATSAMHEVHAHPAQGALAALSSYLLIVPLVLHVAGAVPWTQLVCTAATAVVVGGLTQVAIERLTGRTPQRGSHLPPGVEAPAPRGTTASR